MCGILGINEKFNEKKIREVADSFRYRGPDYQGVYVDDNISLVHNRLSIIDIDARSNQPLSSLDKEIWIVFNGEIFNYKELRQILSKEYEFKTSSDTEVLIYAYQKWGVNLTKYIEGMFAFAIYDKKLNKLFLFRDYIGIKPIYYYDGPKFIFSSEIKGITNLLKEQKVPLKVNKEIFELYFVLGYIPSPYTLYNNIFKLEPSHFMEYDLKSKKILRHRKYLCSSRNIETKSEYITLIEQKILKHVMADVPVGIFFSGGTDSTLIASILKKYNVNLETFSIEMDHKGEDKLFFNKISKYLGVKTNIHKFTVKEFDNIYFEIMTKLDEPLHDSSIFPTYYISKKASQKVKVVLSGEGGDEFFYGYERHKILFKLKDAEDYETTILDKLYFSTPRFRGKRTLFELLFQFNKQPFSYYLLCNSISKDLISWEICKQEFKKRVLNPLDLDKKLYLENDLLRKIDFATSYNSIEGRVPLLDIEITENSVSFEKEHLKNNILKNFLKSILSNYLPKELVYRGKSGFGINIKKLFNDSKYLKKDFVKSVGYLKENNILTVNLDKEPIYYINKFPGFAFALISLYYSIKNNSDGVNDEM